MKLPTVAVTETALLAAETSRPEMVKSPSTRGAKFDDLVAVPPMSSDGPARAGM